MTPFCGADLGAEPNDDRLRHELTRVRINQADLRSRRVEKFVCFGRTE
jgi:hypothetical protein